MLRRQLNPSLMTVDLRGAFPSHPSHYRVPPHNVPKSKRQVISMAEEISLRTFLPRNPKSQMKENCLYGMRL
jgi:hypothetical protein